MFIFSTPILDGDGPEVAAWLEWFESRGIAAGLVEHPPRKHRQIEKYIYRAGRGYEAHKRGGTRPTHEDVPPEGSKLLDSVLDFEEAFNGMAKRG